MIGRARCHETGAQPTIGRVWVGPLDWFQALQQGIAVTGEGLDRMKRGCFRVSQSGTDVSGIPARPFGPVGRCLSIADASLSLSLSLLSQQHPSPNRIR